MKEEPKPKCAECHDDDGVVQFVSIAWPVDERWQGMQWSGWLHPECELILIARLETPKR
jgi:hypothetical protein